MIDIIQGKRKSNNKFRGKSMCLSHSVEKADCQQYVIRNHSWESKAFISGLMDLVASLPNLLPHPF